MMLMRAKKVDIGQALLYGAAAFQAYQFGRALNVYDPSGLAVLHVNVGGLLLGGIVNLVVAISATKLPGIQARARRRWSVAAFAGLLLLSPALVAPAMALVIRESFPLGAGWLALGWSLAPDLAIALGGFIAGGTLVRLGAPSAEGSASAGAPSAPAVRPQSKRSARAVRRSASAVREECAALAAQYACSAPGCGWSPDVDALLKVVEVGKNPRAAAASAKAGHAKAKHPKILTAAEAGWPGTEKQA